MPKTERNPSLEKAAYLRQLLSTDSVALHLDPQHIGVLVPPDWKKSRQGMCLHLGYDLPVKMPDLTVTDIGVSVTLSFGRSPFFCNIPWDAVFLIKGWSSERDYRLWPSAITPDLDAELQRQTQEMLKNALHKSVAAEKKKPLRERPSWVRVIDGDKK